jgi:hypothetical protein
MDRIIGRASGQVKSGTPKQLALAEQFDRNDRPRYNGWGRSVDDLSQQFCDLLSSGGDTASTGVRTRGMHAEHHRLVNPVEINVTADTQLALAA